MADSNSKNRENNFEEALRQFVDARMRGEKPDIEELVNKYPEFEDKIRQKAQSFLKIDALFDSLVRADESDFEDAVAGQELVGTQIGHYKLISVLSEGGMGIVYLAEQKHPIRRKVALKVIKPGMDSKRVVARFESERQALALMDHPNIARVYDAGTTESGRPYFVMEYVKGIPITEHCDRHKLTIEERLKLFLQICEAVQHAHQKGIIHRDIKPTNIIVSIEVDKSIPKIIDFGVAKALSQPLTERTLVTEHGQMLGTPEYMSPEQAEMTGEDIDTRSDIYSLGVLLYGLLTGVLPFETEALRKGGINNVRKMICEQEPKTPSTRLSMLSREKTSVLAKSRRAEPGALQRRLHGDLDWITLKAMEKDRTRRYASVGELGTDIIRHLKNEPVVAGPPSTVYQLKKFMRRHKTFVTGIAAVLVILLAGIVVSTIFAIGQARARAEAERARAEAQTISDFLTRDVLGRASSSIKGREATVLDVLKVSSELLENKFSDQPLIEASIRSTLAFTYIGLGDFKSSVLDRERAYHIYLKQLGEEHRKTLMTMNWLGVSSYYAGEYKEAENLFDSVLRGYTHTQGSVPGWLKCNLANSYARQGRYEEAERLFEEAMEPAMWNADPNSLEYSGILLYSWDLAKVYKEQGRYKDAEELFVKTLNAQREEWGDKGDPRNRAMIRCMNELARLYVIQSRYDEAEGLFTEGIAMGDRELPGKDHPFTLRHVNGLGVLRTKQHRYEEAEALFKRALAGRKLKLGEDHPYTLETKNDLAVLYKEKTRYAEAEPLLLEAAEGRIQKLGQQHPHTKESIDNLIELYEAWNKPEKAEQLRAKLTATDPVR